MSVVCGYCPKSDVRSLSGLLSEDFVFGLAKPVVCNYRLSQFDNRTKRIEGDNGKWYITYLARESGQRPKAPGFS